MTEKLVPLNEVLAAVRDARTAGHLCWDGNRMLLYRERPEWAKDPVLDGDTSVIERAKLLEAINKIALMEQRAGLVMVPLEPSSVMLNAALAATMRFGEDRDNLKEAAKFKAAYGAMLAAAHPIEALEGGKTDSGASGALDASNDNGAQA